MSDTRSADIPSGPTVWLADRHENLKDMQQRLRHAQAIVDEQRARLHKDAAMALLDGLALAKEQMLKNLIKRRAHGAYA